MTTSLLRVLLTVKDLATRLQVKDKTIYAWVSQGKIPSVKINGVIRVDTGEIEHWLQQCHVSIGPPHMPVKPRRNGSVQARDGVNRLVESAACGLYFARGNQTNSEPIRKGVSEWGS